jgi:hypothetical protein
MKKMANIFVNYAGPRRLPILGNLLILETEEPAHIVFTKVREKYGNIFSFDFGGRK